MVTKGQIVIVKTVGNAARYKTTVFEAEVLTVGRKYFTLKSEHYIHKDTKFRLEDLRQETNYTADYKIYLTKEEMEEETEIPKLRKELESILSGKNYKELLKIKEFIDTL